MTKLPWQISAKILACFFCQNLRAAANYFDKKLAAAIFFQNKSEYLQNQRPPKVRTCGHRFCSHTDLAVLTKPAIVHKSEITGGH